MLHSHTTESLLRTRKNVNSTQQQQQQQHLQQNGSVKSPRGGAMVVGLDGKKSPRRKDTAADLGLQVQFGKVLHNALRNKGSEMNVVVNGGYIEEKENDKHVEFSLSCELRIDMHSRRYTEFKELDLALRNRFPWLDLPPLPDASRRFKFFSRRNFEPDYLKTKSNSLDEYLQGLMHIEQVRTCPDFLRFILCPKHKRPPNLEGKVVFQNEKGMRKQRQSSPVPEPITKPEDVLVETESAVSSDDEDDDHDTLVEDLYRQSSCPIGEHSFLSKLMKTNQPISFPGYDSIASITDTNVLIIRFENFKTSISFSQFQFTADNQTIRASTHLDGHPIKLVAQIKATNPSLHGIAQISCGTK